MWCQGSQKMSQERMCQIQGMVFQTNRAWILHPRGRGGYRPGTLRKLYGTMSPEKMRLIWWEKYL